MSGETESNVSPWTVDSLKEHFQMQIDSLEKQHEADIEQVRRETAQALANADKAVTKAENQAEKRFELMNEFRGQLGDQSKTFITRDTYDAHHEALTGRVTTLEKQTFGSSEHKRGGQDQTKAIWGFVGFLISIVALGTILAANGIFG